MAKNTVNVRMLQYFAETDALLPVKEQNDEKKERGKFITEWYCRGGLWKVYEKTKFQGREIY